MEQNKPILLFDGVCNLCEGSVQFLIKRDPKANMLYASLQSEAGQKILVDKGLETSDFVSLVLVEGDRVTRKSSAVLRASKYLKGGWPLAQVALIIPGFIRNFFYNLIAKNRYKWFGKKDQCMIPTPELKARFLD